MPAAAGFDLNFLNEFFDPGREGYDRTRYLNALGSDENRPLTTRIDDAGLLDDQPEAVREPLMEWFALWPQASGAELVRLLGAAVGSEPPRRVLFVYREGDTPVEVEGADFPTDPAVVIVRGTHP
jgi:hypothetical protein